MFCCHWQWCVWADTSSRVWQKQTHVEVIQFSQQWPFTKTVPAKNTWVNYNVSGMQGPCLSFSEEDSLRVSGVETTQCRVWLQLLGESYFPSPHFPPLPAPPAVTPTPLSLPLLVTPTYTQTVSSADLHTHRYFASHYFSRTALLLHRWKREGSPRPTTWPLRGKNFTRQSRLTICRRCSGQHEPIHLLHLRKQGRHLPTIYVSFEQMKQALLMDNLQCNAEVWASEWRQQSEDPFWSSKWFGVNLKVKPTKVSSSHNGGVTAIQT